MLEEAAPGKSSGISQLPVVFSKSEATPLGFIGNPAKEASAANEEHAGKQPGTAQTPVVFSKTEEVIPLGFTNKLLRKIAWLGGATSFILTGASGLTHKNHARTASGIGSAAITFISLGMKERDDALPDIPIPGQMAHAILHPTENTLFFNRSATFFTDALKLVAGFQGNRPKEKTEGVTKMVLKTIDIIGVSDQDKREKLAVLARKNGTDPKEHRDLISSILHSRWTSLTGSLFAAITQVQQGNEHNDKNMRRAGILYLVNVACLAADNAITEYMIKKVGDGREKTCNDRGR